MKMLPVYFVVVVTAVSCPAEAVEVSEGPAAVRVGNKVQITFTVSGKTDVEVAVVDVNGEVVRHLAAGVLGGEKAPPPPLKAGLSQALHWDVKDDFGKSVGDGPFRVRVRAGMRVKFAGFIGADPYNFGYIEGVAVDESGNVYALGTRGILNQGHLTLRVFDRQGRYLREVVPFPADLDPGAMKDVARWDAERKTFRPRNLKSLNPDFYGCPGKWSGYLHLVAASRLSGVVLTDGNRLLTLETTGAVHGEKLVTTYLWGDPDAHAPNSGRGPIHMAFSPDGKYLYLAGIYSSKTKYGHKFNPDFPPGRIYRMELGGGTMKEFVTIDVAHEEGAGGGWLKKARRTPGYGGFPGAVHGLTVDSQRRVYLCDREHDCVAVFDESGKKLTELPVGWPNQVAVHPKTGAVYVMTKDCVAYHRYEKILVKFNGLDAKEPVAKHDLGLAGENPAMALWAGENQTVIWVVGVEGGLVAVEDKGDALQRIQTAFKPIEGGQTDWTRFCVDYRRDHVYASDGATMYWRYDGKTGEGGLLTKNGKPFYANDIEVGHDGLLYVRVSNQQVGKSSPYSGPLWRLDQNLEPAPYAATGTHVLSDYIYSRYGVGYAERGLGPGPHGELYISFMYEWAKYLLGGFGPDGKPINAKYMDGRIQKSNFERGQNKDLTSAVIGPLPSANGGIRVDLKGNIYLGMLYWPEKLDPPHGYDATDRSWSYVVGSVIKFPPEGGIVKLGKKAFAAESVEGGLAVYPGLAPFSRAGFGANTCCVCRVPRFDLDPYGRLALPNAVTCSVWLYDNAGNLIAEVGRYGNFDAQYAGPSLGEGPAEKPIVAVPEIPIGWPTSAGFSQKHLYINDTYHRRVVRTDFTFAAEQTCELP